MKRTTVHLTEKQLRILDGISKDTGLSVAEHIRRAIDSYIKELAKEYDNKRTPK